jgi:hypothetical protein
MSNYQKCKEGGYHSAKSQSTIPVADRLTKWLAGVVEHKGISYVGGLEIVWLLHQTRGVNILKYQLDTALLFYDGQNDDKD